jgi:hypothetical protein
MGRGVSLSPIKEPDMNNTAYKTQAFAKKIWEKSVGAGTEHVMGLLRELHEIKNISSLWDQGRANKTKSYNMLLPLGEQEPPKCPRPQN